MYTIPNLYRCISKWHWARAITPSCFVFMNRYLEKGYRVYMDNFHTSLQLLKSLKERRTFACGTVRDEWWKVFFRLFEMCVDNAINCIHTNFLNLQSKQIPMNAFEKHLSTKWSNGTWIIRPILLLFKMDEQVNYQINVYK